MSFKKISRLSLLTAAVAIGSGLAIGAQAQVYSTIGAELGVGSRGDNVTALQRFLASNRLVYPEGLLTGYFGTLTRNAVTQFQIGHGLPTSGSVGLTTLQKLNSLISAGRPLDISAPIISGPSVVLGSQSATLSWSTNEPASGRVYYGDMTLSAVEPTVAQVPPLISGTVLADSNLTWNKSFTLSNLLPNVIYYYLAMATDANGNVSVTTQGTLRTQ